MKKKFLIPLLLIAAVQLSFISTHSGSVQTTSSRKPVAKPITITTNEFIDISIDVYIPCAAETVTLEGRLHVLTHVTINNNRIVGKTHYQPQGISGVGSVSGDKYQATGVTQDIFSGSLINGQYSFTYINIFRVIGQGTGNNYLVHETNHITVNANGTTTTEVDNIDVECK